VHYWLTPLIHDWGAPLWTPRYIGAFHTMRQTRTTWCSSSEERIVFTDALTAGWRPATKGFVTAVITFRDHPDGTAYSALAMHKDQSDRDRHADLGFHDGWATVAAQLAELVEARSER
jgi:hypothetical protein